MPKLLLATTNRGKARELRNLLAGAPFHLVTPDEEGIDVAVAEEGDSLEENARLKAVAYASASQLMALADDSGLEVDALGGEPGVRSSRYAGPGADDRERVGYLLTKVKDVPWEKRTARFKCVIAIASPDGRTELCHGECQGIVALEPRGDNGFGYDPIFYLPDFNKTMAELPLDIKNGISHRGRAAQKARQVLERMAQKVKT